jgi:hypothetical protein
MEDSKPLEERGDPAEADVARDDAIRNPIIVQFRHKMQKAVGSPFPTFDDLLRTLPEKPEENTRDRVRRIYGEYIEHRRNRYVLAVLAINYLLEHIGDYEGLDELSELASALNDLNSEVGVVRDILSPVKRTRADPSDVWRARALICLALEASRYAGMKRRKSARAIAKTFDRLPLIAGRKAKGRAIESGSYENTIMNWGKRFRAKKVPNDEAQHSFTQSYLSLEEFSGVWPTESMAARAVLFIAEADRLASVITSIDEAEDEVE